MIQSFLTFDSKNKTLSVTTHSEAVAQYFILFLKFPQCVIVENLSILDLALPGVKGLMVLLNTNVSDNIFL